MIRIYLQYSYGGFRTFSIKGEANEKVNNEVTSDNRHDFPSDADCYFQYGGAKMVYRYLSNGELDLVVREIPSIHKDGDGRSIPCAVQFVGDKADRNTLDHMATDIANNLNAFHEFFSYLFRVREGLRIEGDKLVKWIADHETEYVCDTPVDAIADIPSVKDGVIFFVPLSANYGIDATVTENVNSELRLPKELANSHRYISMELLYNVQGKTSITKGMAKANLQAPEPIAPQPKEEDNVAALKQRLEECQEENTKIKSIADGYFAELKTVKQKQSDNERKIAELSAKLAQHKKLTCILGGASLLLAIYSLYLLITK